MNKEKTKKLVGTALLLAIVVVLQLVGASIKFGPFSISLVLVPIVIGGALYGELVGALLGFAFSFIVLVTDAAAFLGFSFMGTVITVLTKGTLAGYVSGLIYKALESKPNKAVLLASISAPIVNTGIFVLGCFIFFIPLLQTWAGDSNVFYYIFFVMIGSNFLFELAVNVALTNVIARLIKIGKSDL